MKIRLLAAATIASLTMVCGMAHADQLSDIKKKGELVVGVLGTDEPLSFIDPKTRELVGYDVDMGRAVAQKLGVKPVFKQITLAARIPELQQGRIDLLAASLTHNKEREGQIDFSLTTFITGQKVMVKANNPIKDVPELAGKRVATAKGSSMEVNIKKAVPTANVISFDTSPQALVAMQQGKAVAFVNDEMSLVRAMVELGDKRTEYKILPANISVEPLALGIRKGEAEFKKVVDETLRELESSGKAENLYEHWFGQKSSLKMGKRSFKIDSDKIDE
ncbi:ABC transporter substrate-binding protein [Diaphorobacter ruginosibacter]|uniref:ABC transporter substrate-binding protein n=1 Tax=Diaphorobacter ruginosibacter TaxID=1715720 RepID=A0A7G9RMR9_9BURK|nr:ABC transporter substrate-binding protein [Diaphorobacter ruginosibacter]MDR2335612.1 ABC transporter substrate-binding protein [Burkholderiaceae bacterium]QNN56894.1 ABC transporter substrate-binding protein [Diaphorobacter ruginosibacter]